MRIRLEKVENGWIVEVVHSAETPTRTQYVARNRAVLMLRLESIIPQDKELSS